MWPMLIFNLKFCELRINVVHINSQKGITVGSGNLLWPIAIGLFSVLRMKICTFISFR